MCPICQREEETIEHLFQCECGKAKAIRHKHIETFIQWTISSKTNEDIKACLIEWLLYGGLKSFKDSVPVGADEELRRIAEGQDEIGWMNFLCGKIDKRWGAYNTKHSVGRKHRRSDLT